MLNRMKFIALLFFMGLSISGLSQIKRSEDEALKYVTHLYERIKTGKNINTIKKLYSEDPGSIKEPMIVSTNDEFDKEFKKQVYSLQLNEVSKPFKHKYGYSIIKVVEINDDKRKIEHILIKFEAN